MTEEERKLGRFKVLGEVARGGMGTILRAWDDDLRRNLALKVLSDEHVDADDPDASTTPLAARFREEAQVTGQLDHPGVVPIHELGEDEKGRPFFAMRLVRGRTFGDIITLVHGGHEGWTQTRALGVLLKVCEAVAFAHEKGVVHRDLKPANLMIGRFGETYVMDWGLARIMDQESSGDSIEDSALSSISIVHTDRKQSSDSETMYGAVVGTPSYMPPEQALGKLDELDERTDIFALGAILYHLLSGHPPYVEEGARVPSHLILKWVVDGPPKPLSEVAPRAHGELAAICEKAMARKPEQRYASTLALAEDLQAYVEGRVVSAYEGGAAAEFKKWVVRNKGMAVATAAAVLAILGAFGGVYWIQHQSRVEVADKNRELGNANQTLQSTIAELGRTNEELGLARDAAHDNAALAQRNERAAVLSSYAANLHAAANALDVGATEDAWASLQACPEELRGWEWNHLDLRTDPSLAVLGPMEARLGTVDWSPDGRIIATAGGSIADQGHDYAVRLWDAESHEPLRVIDAHLARVVSIAFSPDGARIASIGEDGWFRLWQVSTGDKLLEIFTRFEPTDLAFFPDGERVAVTTEGALTWILDLERGGALAELESDSLAQSVAVFPDGERVAIGLGNYRVEIWDVRRRVVERELLIDRVGPDPWRPTSVMGVNDIAIDATGARIAAGGLGRGARVWDVRTGRELARMTGAHANVHGLAFHPNGEWLASAADDHTVALWDSRTGHPVEVLLGHDWIVQDVAFSPDGGRLVSASFDGTLRIWDGQPGSATFTFHGSRFDQRWWAFSLAWSPDATKLAWRPDYEIVQVLDAHTGELLYKADTFEAIADVAFTPDSDVLLTLNYGGKFQAWDGATGEAHETRLLWEGQAENAEFHPSGLFAIACRDLGEDRSLEVWDLATGEKVHELRGHEDEVTGMAFGRQSDLLYAGGGSKVHVWDLATGQLVNLIPTESHVFDLALLFEPGAAETAVVTCSSDHREKRLAVYDLATGERLRELRCSAPPIFLDVTPDGQRIAASNLDGGISLLHPERGELVRLRGHRDSAFKVAFSPDGLRLASQDYMSLHRIWDTVHPRERAALREPALERRAVMGAARPAFDRLLSEFRIPEVVSAELAGTSTMDPILREAAVGLADRSVVHYYGIQLEVLETLVRPDLSREEYERVYETVVRMRGSLNDDTSERAYLGMALCRMGRYEEALEAMGDAVTRNIFGSSAGAMCYWHLGDHERAHELLTVVTAAPVLRDGGRIVQLFARNVRELERLMGKRQ